MKKETRIQRIQEIVDRNKKDPPGKMEIPWEGKLRPENVYHIPLKLLVYNKYNGRILSRTKSLETQDHIIDAETETGKKLIEDLLYKSKPDKNEHTKSSLKKYGQEKVGIITKDGIIIDGNRRVMLLNKIDHIDHFKAVVLPVTLEENPEEMSKFETIYQLGEDQKLDYNPIEIYLIIQKLYKQISGKSKFELEDVDKKAIKQIYSWIGNYKTIKGVGDIEYSLSIMNIMDDYLDSLEYNGIYTALDDREEQFRELTRWLDNFYGETSGKAFQKYRNDDVDDLKAVCYDLIRLKYKNEKFRYVGRGQRQNHLFGDKQIWASFQKSHFEELKGYEEHPIDYNSSKISHHLNDRDSDFNSKLGKIIDANVDLHYQKLRNRQSADEPKILVKRAIDSFKAINTGHSSFSKPEVQNDVEELSAIVFSALKEKSPSRILSHVIDMLLSIKVDKIPDSEIEDVQAKTKKIQQIGYKINKQL